MHGKVGTKDVKLARAYLGNLLAIAVEQAGRAPPEGTGVALGLHLNSLLSALHATGLMRQSIATSP